MPRAEWSVLFVFRRKQRMAFSKGGFFLLSLKESDLSTLLISVCVSECVCVHACVCTHAPIHASVELRDQC